MTRPSPVHHGTTPRFQSEAFDHGCILTSMCNEYQRERPVHIRRYLPLFCLSWCRRARQKRVSSLQLSSRCHLRASLTNPARKRKALIQSDAASCPSTTRAQASQPIEAGFQWLTNRPHLLFPSIKARRRRPGSEPDAPRRPGRAGRSPLRRMLRLYRPRI